MNLENRFLAIKLFLLEHQELLGTEVLENYQNLEQIYGSWSNELSLLSSTDKISLENELSSSRLENHEYQDFLLKIKSLINVKDVPYSKVLIPPNLKRKLTLKKQHEIQQITDFFEDKEATRFLDIGSGAGHLSSILLNASPDKSSICIDLSEEYQQIGISKLKREAPSILKRIQFIPVKVNKAFRITNFNFDILLGLHTCGDLAVDLIHSYLTVYNKAFLGFGCCYHKLTYGHTNLSRLSKQDKELPLSFHALTMAAKSYKNLGQKEFNERCAVKNYRYTLHLYMKEVLNLPFTTLGNAKAQDYKLSFSQYALKFVTTLNSSSVKQLDEFYKKNFERVQKIQNLGIIRSHLSRLLEYYIILDRALFLEESGKKVEIIQFFDRKISPRNLGIWAKS